MDFVEKKMKVIAAFLLAVLGGNASPSAVDLKKILASGIPIFNIPNLFCLIFIKIVDVGENEMYKRRYPLTHCEASFHFVIHSLLFCFNLVYTHFMFILR